jgi:hypothetical protein
MVDNVKSKVRTHYYTSSNNALGKSTLSTSADLVRVVKDEEISLMFDGPLNHRVPGING